MSGRREEILDAAMAIAGERGLEAVSMRAVANRIGVTPMALYRHIGGKDALLDGILGRLLAALLPAKITERQPWDARLTALARACRELAHRYPWAPHMLFSRPAVSPDALRAVDLLYTALLDAGVPDREVPRLERLISTFIIGFAASEASGRFAAGTLDSRGRRAQLPETELPGHTRLAEWLDLPADPTAEFEADLDEILRLIQAAARTDE